METHTTPKHAGHTEWWIEARAHLNRHGITRGRHGVRHGNPSAPEPRTIARLKRITRALTFKPRNGRHGVTYARIAPAFALAA